MYFLKSVGSPLEEFGISKPMNDISSYIKQFLSWSHVKSYIFSELLINNIMSYYHHLSVTWVDRCFYYCFIFILK